MVARWLNSPFHMRMLGQIPLAGRLETETSPCSDGPLPGSLRASPLGETGRRQYNHQLLTHGRLTDILTVRRPSSGEALDPSAGLGWGYRDAQNPSDSCYHHPQNLHATAKSLIFSRYIHRFWMLGTKMPRIHPLLLSLSSESPCNSK